MARTSTVSRQTRETDIQVTVDLDGSGKNDMELPIPFLAHMVDQIARHALMDFVIRVKGDTEVDGHHTTEDLAFVLGQAIASALGDKAQIQRYGWATLPMDEARATCAIDLGGRPSFVWEVPMRRGSVGSFDAELAEVFFEGFARGATCNLHVVLHTGHILHHIIEVCFKALAYALRAAVRVEPRAAGVPSTKGSL